MVFTIQNDSALIPRLVEQVESYLMDQEVPARPVSSVALCLEELLLNTIQYGYDDTETHEIGVEVQVLDDRMKVEILDDAKPFDPTREAPEPDLEASVHERQIGGLGIHLVKNLVDSIAYERHLGKNRLRFEVRIDREAPT